MGVHNCHIFFLQPNTGGGTSTFLVGTYLQVPSIVKLSQNEHTQFCLIKRVCGLVLTLNAVPQMPYYAVCQHGQIISNILIHQTVSRPDAIKNVGQTGSPIILPQEVERNSTFSLVVRSSSQPWQC